MNKKQGNEFYSLLKYVLTPENPNLHLSIIAIHMQQKKSDN